MGDVGNMCEVKPNLGIVDHKKIYIHMHTSLEGIDCALLNDN